MVELPEQAVGENYLPYDCVPGKGVTEKVANLKMFLKEHKVSWEWFGEKNVRKLLKEIEDGECRLIYWKGQLKRLVSPVLVDVYYYTPEGQCLVLYAEVKGKELPGHSLGGKVRFNKGKKSESPIEAAQREVSEELRGLSLGEGRFLGGGMYKPFFYHIPSPYDPVLETEYINPKVFDVFLNLSEYQERYTDPTDATTIFKWAPSRQRL